MKASFLKKAVSLALTTLCIAQTGMLVACESETEKVKGVIPTYDITASAGVGGTVSASASTVEQGGNVTITYSAQEDYFLKNLTINGGEVIPENGSYSVYGVVCDLDVKATFAKSDVSVNYMTGFETDGLVIESGSVAYGAYFGELPTPVMVGQRFLGWEDESGERVRETSKVDESGEITLNARWETLTDEEMERLVPYSLTSSYYDAAATKYGVVFHTEIEPIAPRIYVKKKDSTPATGIEDFLSAPDVKIVDCTSELWMKYEYISRGVVEDLEFATTYEAIIGEYASQNWTDVYTFTTREEVVDKAEFFYMLDTQEMYDIAHQSNYATVDKNIGDTFWSQVMEDATAKHPNAKFVAHGGDMVQFGSVAYQYEEMFGSVEEYLFNLPIVMTAGNHLDPSYYSTRWETVSKLFNVDCPEGGANARGMFYSFDYGPMHFVVFRDNDAAGTGYTAYDETQMEWVRQDLQSAKENKDTPWTVFMLHISPLRAITVSSDRHARNIFPIMMPIFDEYDVDLVLTAHDHNYEASYPLVWEEGYALDGIEEDYTRLGGKILTKNYQTETYDGNSLASFTYGDGQHGTIILQISATGPMVKNNFKYTELSQNLEKFGYWRMLLSTGKNMLVGIDGIKADTIYPMYSYIEIDKDKLIARSYAVDVSTSQVTDENRATLAGTRSVFIDGFAIHK